MERVRAGDGQAAEQLVQRYAPALRRILQVRLVDARLRRLFDADDLCQSVLASFFMRASLGQYHLDEPADLLKLLATMARNKVVDKRRRKQVEGSEEQRIPLADLADGLVAPTPTPSHCLSVQELVQEARRRLSPEERLLLELRAEGHEWADIANRFGESAEALRKRLTRAVNRVAQELSPDEVAHE